MKLETLKERIQNAETKIEKKSATIIKKQARIEKLQSKITKEFGIDPETFNKYEWRQFGEERGNDLYWDMCTVEHLKEDIERNQNEIKELQANLEKYNQQMSGEIEKDRIITKEIPEALKRMQNELVEKWDIWDKAKREKIKKDRQELSYKDYCKRWNHLEREMVYLSDEQIHSANVESGKYFVLDLYNRVKRITGEITDWSYIRLQEGNMFPVLNGVVVGKTGKAVVESIDAGGWNIQREHIRVLVKEVM